MARHDAKGRAKETDEAARRGVPGRRCASSTRRRPFQLLGATILSAQTTDERVNLVTPTLFARYPTPTRWRRRIRPTSSRSSSRRASTATRRRAWSGWRPALVERFDGEVPGGVEDLVTLPGVGRKTGNVVRSVAMDEPGLPVDTHVGRLRHPPRTHDADRPGEGRARAQRPGPGPSSGARSASV